MYSFNSIYLNQARGLQANKLREAHMKVWQADYMKRAQVEMQEKIRELTEKVDIIIIKKMNTFATAQVLIIPVQKKYIVSTSIFYVFFNFLQST